jgi:uncharacterized protein (TIGR03118 family)
MKKSMFWLIPPWVKSLSFTIVVLMVFIGCRKHESPLISDDYDQVNLVSDVSGYGAARIDPNLVNPWGISFSATSPLWISSNAKSVSLVYDKNGNTVIPPVTIQNGNGAPTGQVFNGTTGFVIPENNKPARFIFAGEDGTLSAWNGGPAAIQVVDRSKEGAVYKGLASGNDGSANFLYAANFKGSKVEVFDSMFHYVSGTGFEDPSIPSDYGPFNIRNINGQLFVTYAKHKAPENKDDEKGAGNGYVDVYSMKGVLITHFASRGVLNSPWGIVPAVPGFLSFPDGIIIGNFGDGHINVFDQHGHFVGALKNESGHEITIDGLWALENNVPGADPQHLYFTAGPAKETNGLFGYIVKMPD